MKLQERDQSSKVVLDELTLLVARSVVDTTLQDAAAMAMGTDDDTVSANSVGNELSIFRRQVVETPPEPTPSVKVSTLPDSNFLALPWTVSFS